MNTNSTPAIPMLRKTQHQSMLRRPFAASSVLGSARRFAIVLATLVLWSSSVPVHAEQNAPFSAELTVVFAGKDREAFIFAVEGVATQMGHVTGYTRHEVRGPHELGLLYLIDNSGDTLICSYEFKHDPVLSVGTYKVLGGTGRFANATGGGVMFADQTHMPGDPFPAELVGTISF